jgi:hypothetical protein
MPQQPEKLQFVVASDGMTHFVQARSKLRKSNNIKGIT